MADPGTYVQLPADSSHRGGTRAMPPKAIIMHATGGTDSRAWLTTTPGSGVSSHFLIRRDGVIYRLVENSGVAWHAGVSRFGNYGAAGRPSVNEISIGIELENLNTGGQPYPTIQIQQAARVVWRLHQQYGHIPTVSHQAIAPTRKDDPKGFPWESFYNVLKTLIKGTFV